VEPSLCGRCRAFHGLVHAVRRRNGTCFDSSSYRKFVISLQSDLRFSFTTPEYSLQSNGTLLNSSDDMTLTVRGCDEFRGRAGFCPDAPPGIVTWIIPVLLLLSYIELSPIEKKRYMAINHVPGDPIDAFWSIMHKIYAWNQLYRVTRLDWKRVPTTFTNHFRQKIKPWYSYSNISLGLLSAIGFMQPQFANQKPGQKTEAGLSRDSRARIIATILSGFGKKKKSNTSAWMVRHISTARRMYGSGLYFTSVVSFIAAFLIFRYAIPEGFGCRSVWPLWLFCIWITSAFITNIMYVCL
jgi:hypothetical protein